MHLQARADFVICAKRRRRRRIRRKKPENLVTSISGMIYFNFGMYLPFIGGDFYSKFSDLRIKDDGSINV